MISLLCVATPKRRGAPAASRSAAKAWKNGATAIRPIIRDARCSTFHGQPLYRLYRFDRLVAEDRIELSTYGL